MIRRTTRQRMLVYDAVMQLDTHPTSEEIYNAVHDKCPKISRATVYRNLNVLADEGKILRIEIANAPDRFDRTTSPHCHFRCSCCGKVFDSDIPAEAVLKLCEASEYRTTGCEVIFSGFCHDCCGKV